MKIDLIDYRDKIIDFCVNDNLRYLDNHNQFEFKRIERTNSMFDTIILEYKHYNFENEVKFFVNNKVKISEELYKLSYIFDYNRIKDKLSIKQVYQTVREYNHPYKKGLYYYANRKEHICTISNNGKIYQFVKGKPRIANIISRTRWSYLTNIIQTIKLINPITGYATPLHTDARNFTIKELSKYNSISELKQVIIDKFGELFVDINSTIYSFPYYFNNMFSKKSIEYIKNNFNNFIKKSRFKDSCIDELQSSTHAILKEFFKTIPNNPTIEDHVITNMLNYRTNYKIDIFNLDKSITVSRRKKEQKDFNNKIKELTKEVVKYYTINSKKIVKIFKENNIDVKVLESSSNTDLINFIRNKQSYVSPYFFKKNNYVIGVYENNEIVDVLIIDGYQTVMIKAILYISNKSLKELFDIVHMKVKRKKKLHHNCFTQLYGNLRSLEGKQLNEKAGVTPSIIDVEYEDTNNVF